MSDFSDSHSSLPRLFNDTEAAEYLRMSKVTLWRERSSGRLGFRRCAGRLVYTQRDLEEYLDRCSNRPAQNIQIAKRN